MHFYTFFGYYLVWAASMEKAIEALEGCLVDHHEVENGVYSLDEFVHEKTDQDDDATAIEFIARLPDDEYVEIPYWALPTMGQDESDVGELTVVYAGTIEQWTPVLNASGYECIVFDLNP